jgi:gluconolactonase
MRKSVLLVSAVCLVGLVACSQSGSVDTVETASPRESAGTIEEVVAVAPSLFSEDAIVEDLGGNFAWSEGPVWMGEGEAGYLLFTDVPNAAIWRYDDEDGLTEWMQPSTRPGAQISENSQGANGLFKLNEDEILVPDHGSRTLYALNVMTKSARIIADKFDGKTLNSPNDTVVHSSGTIYFTDPPYGLPEQDDDPAKEQAVNGVYAVSPDGSVTLIDGSLTRPNGIALSPDESLLYVANSDPNDSSFHRYPVSRDGQVGVGELLIDMTAERQSIGYGNPDGMVVATDGTLFVTGPGGLIALSPDGEILSRLSVGKPCANVTFGGPEKSDLYLTCFQTLYRVAANRTGL